MCIALAVKVLTVISDLRTNKLQHIIEKLSAVKGESSEEYYQQLRKQGLQPVTDAKKKSKIDTRTYIPLLYCFFSYCIRLSQYSPLIDACLQLMEVDTHLTETEDNPDSKLKPLTT